MGGKGGWHLKCLRGLTLKSGWWVLNGGWRDWKAVHITDLTFIFDEHSSKYHWKTRGNSPAHWRMRSPTDLTLVRPDALTSCQRDAVPQATHSGNRTRELLLWRQAPCHWAKWASSLTFLWGVPDSPKDQKIFLFMPNIFSFAWQHEISLFHLLTT